MSILSKDKQTDHKIKIFNFLSLIYNFIIAFLNYLLLDYLIKKIAIKIIIVLFLFIICFYLDLKKYVKLKINHYKEKRMLKLIEYILLFSYDNNKDQALKKASFKVLKKEEVDIITFLKKTFQNDYLSLFLEAYFVENNSLNKMQRIKDQIKIFLNLDDQEKKLNQIVFLKNIYVISLLNLLFTCLLFMNSNKLLFLFIILLYLLHILTYFLYQNEKMNFINYYYILTNYLKPFYAYDKALSLYDKASNYDSLKEQVLSNTILDNIFLNEEEINIYNSLKMNTLSKEVYIPKIDKQNNIYKIKIIVICQILLPLLYLLLKGFYL